MKWEMLAQLISLGTTIKYIFEYVIESVGGPFYFGMLVSSSQMNKLSTYTFITCMVLRGNIYDIIMIFKKAISCTRINPDLQNVEEFDVQPEIPAPIRKIKLHLSSS